MSWAEQNPNLPRVVSWFSCGAASAVATKLAIAKYGKRVVPTYCLTHSEHPDNQLFYASCIKWFGVPVTMLQSDEYADTWDVWTRRKYLAGIDGAPCTVELKIKPRLAFQKPDDLHVFGYTADKTDVERAKRLRDNFPELAIDTPLIDRGLTKSAVIEIVFRAGLPVPPMYALGFQNNNCIPCVKATSPNYWALIRKHFPSRFDRAAKLSRHLDVRLCRIAGERAFIDEIPLDQPTTDPISPSCDFLCHLAEMEIQP
jgi:hypothetical protein